MLSQNFISLKTETSIKKYMKHLTTEKPDKSHLTEKTLFWSPGVAGNNYLSLRSHESVFLIESGLKKWSTQQITNAK